MPGQRWHANAGGAGAGGVPHHRFTGCAEGDLAASSVGVERRRAAVVDLDWTWLRQAHGAGVVVVEGPGHGAGAEADAAVTAVTGSAVSVAVADCAPVALSAVGVVGVAHAGWRGLVAGVLPATVAAMRALGAGEIAAQLGPCIQPCCYAFGEAELALVSDAVGADVSATTSDGALALDVGAGVAASLARVGVDLDRSSSRCTAHAPGELWSHRARGDRERQAAVAWLA